MTRTLVLALALAGHLLLATAGLRYLAGTSLAVVLRRHPRAPAPARHPAFARLVEFAHVGVGLAAITSLTGTAPLWTTACWGAVGIHAAQACYLLSLRRPRRATTWTGFGHAETVTPLSLVRVVAFGAGSVLATDYTLPVSTQPLILLLTTTALTASLSVHFVTLRPPRRRRTPQPVRPRDRALAHHR